MAAGAGPQLGTPLGPLLAAAAVALEGATADAGGAGWTSVAGSVAGLGLGFGLELGLRPGSGLGFGLGRGLGTGWRSGGRELRAAAAAGRRLAVAAPKHGRKTTIAVMSSR